MRFVERHGLWSGGQFDAAARLKRIVEEQKLEVIRLSFPDQHGILRGKTLISGEALRCLESGCSITTTMFAKDTSHKTVFPVFAAGGGFGIPEMQGAADALMIPDPATFRVLPWSPGAGWLLCDVHFADGRPVPFATRHLYKTVLSGLAERGYDFVAGLEVECHIFRNEETRMAPEDAGQPGRPPDVSLLSHGYQYLTEQRYDQMEPVLEIIRRDVVALGLPLRSVEVEFGPSQCEFTFQPGVGLAPADDMVLFRSAVKQICHRRGYHATFMCRPKIPNVVSSGWHLHQSIVSRANGANAFTSTDPNQTLSPFGRGYLAGLLRHARAAAAFATPTINGYKRYRSYSLAPDRAVWGRDNRGAMIRVLGGPDDSATRHGGEITVGDQDVSGRRTSARAALGVGYVPQTRDIFPSLTVEENLRTGLKGRPTAALTEAYEMFPRLRDRRRNYGMQLSGGEQQMLLMARTLLGKPSILLLDKPLAPVICDELMALLIKLAETGEVTIVLVEQQIERALDFAGRVMVMERRRISWSGPPDVLIADRALVDRLIGVGIH